MNAGHPAQRHAKQPVRALVQKYATIIAQMNAQGVSEPVLMIARQGARVTAIQVAMINVLTVRWAVMGLVLHYAQTTVPEAVQEIAVGAGEAARMIVVAAVEDVMDTVLGATTDVLQHANSRVLDVLDAVPVETLAEATVALHVKTHVRIAAQIPVKTSVVVAVRVAQPAVQQPAEIPVQELAMEKQHHQYFKEA